MGIQKHKMTHGAPERSILNRDSGIARVLSVRVSKGCTAIAQSNDIVLVITVKQELVYKRTRALRNISEWITLNNLKIAPHKIEALVVKHKEGEKTSSSR